MNSLKEFRRCLARTGKWILVDWCDDFWTCKLCSLWLRLTDPAFFCTYSLKAGRDMLVDAGFDVTHAERFKVSWQVSWLWGMMLFVGGKTADSDDRRSSSAIPST